MRPALALVLAVGVGCGEPPSPLHQISFHGPLGAPSSATAAANVLYATATMGGRSAPLLVDTGAPVVALSPARLPIPAGVSTVDGLAIGPLTLDGVPALGVDLFGARPGFTPGGLLGADLLCQFALTLDYRAATIQLGAAAPLRSDGVTSPGTRLAVRLEGGGRGALGGVAFRYPATRIVVPVTIDGTPRMLLVDSGASYTVLRDALFAALVGDGRPTLEGVPIRSADGVLAGRMARARAVVLAGESVAGPPILDVGDGILDGLAAEVGHPVDGLLGGDWLREFLVTIDYPTKTLLLQRYATRDHIDPDELHQVGIAITAATVGAPHRYQIAQVYAGTSAARAGVRPGDPLIAIAGQSIDGIDEDVAERLLHGPVGAARDLDTSAGHLAVTVDDLLPPLR